MPTKDDLEMVDTVEDGDGRQVIRSSSIPTSEDDPAAPSKDVSSKRQRLSDLWTIFCAGCALMSDGYANSLMTLINVVANSMPSSIPQMSVHAYPTPC